MKLKPELTPEEIVQGKIAIAKLREIMNIPVQDKRKKDLGMLDDSHMDARLKYDTDAIGVFFQACGWSDYQMFLQALEIAVEHQGPNAVREIERLSRADALWARHLATSREPQRGVQ